MSRRDHHPPHIHLDDTWYMITGAIYQKRRLLQPKGYKDLVHEQLKTLIAAFGLELAAWVILDNHYHLLVKTNIVEGLPHFLGRLHGRTSFELNSREGTHGRQVWHNYWDTCIRGETDYWKRFNYIRSSTVTYRRVKIGRSPVITTTLSLKAEIG